jgi:hypothetical protein
MEWSHIGDIAQPRGVLWIQNEFSTLHLHAARIQPVHGLATCSLPHDVNCRRRCTKIHSTSCGRAYVDCSQLLSRDISVVLEPCQALLLGVSGC